MPDRKVIHVTPKGDQWSVKKEGADRALRNFDTKKEAVDHGRQAAKNASLGQLKIHGSDGKIQTEHTYGKDPRDIPG